jgi:hypothetical protein
MEIKKESIENIIIFVDSSTSINHLEKIIEETKGKVISFDYSTHIKLNSKNISHVISDNYSSEEEVEKMQKICYKFLNWHEEKKFHNELKFQEINIPKLFNDEFFSSLVKVMKKFSEIRWIFNKEKNLKIFASNDLLEIVKLFTKSYSELKSIENVEKFYFDKIEMGVNLGKRNITLPISRTWYNKIKNQGETILQMLFGPNERKNKGKASLLIEFNTKNFDDFLVEGKENEKNMLFYGRRRPAVWDLQSFNIIKKSGCKIITAGNISDKKQIEEIELNSKKFKEKFSNFLENDELLKRKFIIDEISVWSVLKPKIKNLVERRIKNVIYEISLAKKIFKKYSIGVVLLISEAGLTEQIIMNHAKINKVPILHFQEGLHFDTREAFENEVSQGVYPEFADEYIVWGDIYKNDAISNAKINSEKINVLGSPRFNKLSVEDNHNAEEFVLLATMPPQIEDIRGHNVKYLKKYLESILRVCEIVSKQNKKLVIKIHPTFDVLEISKNVKKNYPHVQVVSKGDINPLIRSCSTLIVTGLTTVIIQAQILEKPVISIPLIDYKWGNPSVFKSGSCIETKIENLDLILKKVIEDREFRNEIINRGKKFVNECIKNREEASKKIWAHIKNLKKIN